MLRFILILKIHIFGQIIDVFISKLHYIIYFGIKMASHIDKQTTYQQLYNMRPDSQALPENSRNTSKSRSKSTSRIFKYKDEQIKSRLRPPSHGSQDSSYYNNNNRYFSRRSQTKTIKSDDNFRSHLIDNGKSNLTYIDNLYPYPKIQVPKIRQTMKSNAPNIRYIEKDPVQIRQPIINNLPIKFNYQNPREKFHPKIQAVIDYTRTNKNANSSQFSKITINSQTPASNPPINFTKFSTPQITIKPVINPDLGPQRAINFVRPSSYQKINQNEMSPKKPLIIQEPEKSQPIISSSPIIMNKSNPQITYYKPFQMMHQFPQPYQSYSQPIKPQIYKQVLYPQHQNITNYVTIHDPVVLKQIHQVHHIHEPPYFNQNTYMRLVPVPISEISTPKQSIYVGSELRPSFEGASSNFLEPLKQESTQYLNTTAPRQSQFQYYSEIPMSRELSKSKSKMKISAISSPSNNHEMFEQQNFRSSKFSKTSLDRPIAFEAINSQSRIGEEKQFMNNRYFDQSLKLPLKRLDSLTANVKQLTTKKIQEPKYETWSITSPKSDISDKNSLLIYPCNKINPLQSPTLNNNNKDLQQINQLSLSEIKTVNRSQSGIELSSDSIQPVVKKWTNIDYFIILFLVALGVALILFQLFK